ncbi:hypothetical protein L209DRAFT_740196 [Thermothelomyces heterothallicus CBS 203.75]
MVGSALALSLIGLGAVKALPAAKKVEERQVWLGPGNGDFHPGDGDLQPCLTDVPLEQQPPCLLPPIVGPINPSTRKRGFDKRQIWIWPGTGDFHPGDGDLEPCLTDVPLETQPPCILPPIVGPINPSTKKRGLDKRQIWLWPGTGDFHPGDGDPKPCLITIPLQQQPPCLLPPIVGPIEPSTKKKRQAVIGDPSGGDVTPGQGDLPPCLTDTPLNQQPPCLLPPIVGGIDPSTKKRGVVLPSDYATNPKGAIEQLEKELIRLQNKSKKTKKDLEDIVAIKAALRYLAGITNISAPPGTGTTFTPGKRDAAHCSNLEAAELALESLLHKDKLTAEEKAAKKKLTAFLKSCGITIIKSPDGTTTIIKPSD